MIKLKIFLKIDPNFLALIKEDLLGREPSEENINFILEEIVVVNLIRHKLVKFKKNLIDKDLWRLIAYPGSYIKSDYYQYKKNVLVKQSKNHRFQNCQYNLEDKIIYDFEKM